MKTVLDEKITLDMPSFKALASETRVAMLKKLGVRRATASELAGSLGISVQAASEHLEKMREAGLVARLESPPRRWVYYELTEKGRALLHPAAADKRIWVLLSIGLLAMAVGATQLFLNTGFLGGVGACTNCYKGVFGADAGTPRALTPAPQVLGAAGEAAAEAVQVPQASPQAAAQVAPLSSWEVLLTVFGALAFGCGLFLLLKKKKAVKELEESLS